MIRRKKQTIFTDAKDTTTVYEIKKIVEGILKKSPDDQRLYSKDNVVMEDQKQLSEYGYSSTTAKAQSPETIGLSYRIEGKEDFEPLEITPLSTPPDLPEVMKSESNPAQANDSADK